MIKGALHFLKTMLAVFAFSVNRCTQAHFLVFERCGPPAHTSYRVQEFVSRSKKPGDDPGPLLCVMRQATVYQGYHTKFFSISRVSRCSNQYSTTDATEPNVNLKALEVFKSSSCEFMCQVFE